MSTTLPASLLDSLKVYLQTHIGLTYTEKQELGLIKKISDAAVAFGYENPIRFTEWLLASELTDQQISTLASYLTIGETYFLREKKSFDFLEQIYLPALILKRMGSDRRLRIWCAGCATGEEAYSIAIVLLQSIPDIQKWDIKILATDINEKFLEKAKKGIYTKWSFRNNPPEFIHKYFILGDDKTFQILPAIKKMVTFAHHNLIKNNNPAAHDSSATHDIIFCRNVFIYFSPENTKLITTRFYQSLTNGGILLVSPVEMSGFINPEFNKITYAGFTIYQKDTNHQTGKQTPAFNSSGFAQYPVRQAQLPKQYPVEKAYKKHELIQQQQPLIEKPSVIEVPLLPDFENASLLFSQGLFEQAETILTVLFEKEVLNISAVISLLAKTKANLGKLLEAEELCIKGLTHDKLDPSLYYLQATIMQELGKDDMAITSLKQALYIDHDFILAHFLLGALSLKSGNKAFGMKAYQNALSCLDKLSPDDVIPESEGLLVKNFKVIINTITG
jgi:chemotaxis protein methyltransferase CheR